MLHAIQGFDHPGQSRLIASMFADRKRVFVDLLKWDLPVLAGRFEIDHRDGPEATYLIVTDADCEHLASARLLPVTHKDQIPELCGAAIPGHADRGLRIAEMTHFCLSPDVDAGRRRHARDTLLHGLVDHALTNAISRFVGVAEGAWLDRVETFGWQCRRLGRAEEARGRAVPFAIDIDAATPSRLAAAGILVDASGPAAS